MFSFFDFERERDLEEERDFDFLTFVRYALFDKFSIDLYELVLLVLKKKNSLFNNFKFN